MTNNQPSASTRNKVLITAIGYLCRIIVGGTFILSGFVKSIDPWGSFYKLADYASAFQITLSDQLLLMGDFALGGVEFILGVLLLVGAFRRVVPILLMLTMLIMLPLTFYLYAVNPHTVADCGCFGDAIILTNSATFWKNVVLTVLLVFLIMYNHKVRSLYGPAVHWIVLLLSALYISIVSFYGYQIQPLLDFRPYSIGTKITSSLDGQATDQVPEYDFIYAKDGKEQAFTIDNLPDEAQGWVYVDRRERKPNTAADTVARPTIIPIYDYQGLPVDTLFTPQSKVLLLLFPNLLEANIAHTFVINELTEYAAKQHVSVVGLTSATERNVQHWNDISMATYPIYKVEDTELKTIARGNPSAVYVEDGKIVWKRTVGSINMDDLEAHRIVFNSSLDTTKQMQHLVLQSLTLMLVILMLVLLIFNRTHLLVRFGFQRFFKPQKGS